MKNIKLDKVVKEYILDAISTDGYDFSAQTNEEKVKFLYKTFSSEYGWNIARVGEYKAFQEWMMGLPSSFNIDFENYKIIQLAIQWGSITENHTEKQAENILANWWNFIAAKTFQLFRKYKVAK